MPAEWATRPARRSPEVSAARSFEEHLGHSLKQGGFLAIIVRPRHLLRAEAELMRRVRCQPTRSRDIDAVAKGQVVTELSAGARELEDLVVRLNLVEVGTGHAVTDAEEARLGLDVGDADELRQLEATEDDLLP